MSNSISFVPTTTGLASVDGGSPVTFDLTNNSNETLNLYWLDHSGTPQLYGTLGPNGIAVQPTFATHAWEVTSADGAVSFEFNSSLAGNITVGTNDQPTFTDFSEKIIQAPNGAAWSTSQGYGLINVAKSLGVPDLGANLSLNTQSNNIALDAISASSAWAAGYTGKGVTVAVLDVGIASNPEVNANIIGGHDFADDTGNTQPDAGAYQDHPLGVASIIAGSHTQQAGPDTMGVAPDASLLNVKVGNSSGSSDTNIATGIHWAVDNGAKVICMPLEGQSSSNDPLIAQAVDYAFQHNVVTVIIGGNYSNYGPTGPALAGVSGEAILVGNYDAEAGTNFGSSNLAGGTPINWVMASSSGYTPTAAAGYAFHSDGGTSFAGPYVAGLAALLEQQNPTATASQIIAKIEAGASLSTNSVVTGTVGNDTFAATSTASTIDGGAGIDTVQFDGAMTNYTIVATSTGFTVTDNTGHDGTATLMNVERLQFTDTNFALDTGNAGNAGEIFRLYQAAFDRAPEPAGLGFWLQAMDGGQTITQIAQEFTQSAEFIKLYGANPTNTQLVTAMYENVLHREPEAAGLSFWVTAMDTHQTTEATLLTSFSNSAENETAAIKIIGQGAAYTPMNS